MNNTLILFSVFGAVLFLVSLKKIRLKHWLLSAITGVSAFFATDFICSFFSGGLPLNGFSAAVSLAGGIPGVILLTFLHTFIT